jgi:hypothetical protein
MDLNELMEMLEIDEPGEFEYFENLADLLESDETIPEETLFQLFSQTDSKTVADLIHTYFDDMLEAMPESSTEMFTLLENIKRSLIGLLQTSEEESLLRHFVEELFRFKTWFCFESEVGCKSLSGGEEKMLPLRDALILSRLEKMEEDEYQYDFENCLKYEIDEYIMSFADLAIEEEEDDEEKTDLLDSGFVYDDEMKD